jgi:hypothetical protein
MTARLADGARAHDHLKGRGGYTLVNLLKASDSSNIKDRGWRTQHPLSHPHQMCNDHAVHSIECVLYRMCSLQLYQIRSIECVLYRMCSLQLYHHRWQALSIIRAVVSSARTALYCVS